MNDENKMVLTVLAFVAICLGAMYWYITSSCAEVGEMHGYSITKTVATKCYGSNNGYNWERIWY